MSEAARQVSADVSSFADVAQGSAALSSAAVTAEAPADTSTIVVTGGAAIPKLSSGDPAFSVSADGAAVVVSSSDGLASVPSSCNTFTHTSGIAAVPTVVTGTPEGVASDNPDPRILGDASLPSDKFGPSSEAGFTSLGQTTGVHPNSPGPSPGNTPSQPLSSSSAIMADEQKDLTGDSGEEEQGDGEEASDDEERESDGESDQETESDGEDDEETESEEEEDKEEVTVEILQEQIVDLLSLTQR